MNASREAIEGELAAVLIEQDVGARRSHIVAGVSTTRHLPWILMPVPPEAQAQEADGPFAEGQRGVSPIRVVADRQGNKPDQSDAPTGELLCGERLQ